MVYKVKISAKEGERFRVIINGRVSSALPRIRILKEEYEKEYQEELKVGDTVAVVIFNSTLADGLVLGKVVEE